MGRVGCSLAGLTGQHQPLPASRGELQIEARRPCDRDQALSSEGSLLWRAVVRRASDGQSQACFFFMPTRRLACGGHVKASAAIGVQSRPLFFCHAPPLGVWHMLLSRLARFRQHFEFALLTAKVILFCANILTQELGTWRNCLADVLVVSFRAQAF